jgi:hypothetical protein
MEADKCVESESNLNDKFLHTGQVRTIFCGDQRVAQSPKLAPPLPKLGLGGGAAAGIVCGGACSPVSRSVVRLPL